MCDFNAVIFVDPPPAPQVVVYGPPTSGQHTMVTNTTPGACQCNLTHTLTCTEQDVDTQDKGSTCTTTATFTRDRCRMWSQGDTIHTPLIPTHTHTHIYRPHRDELLRQMVKLFLRTFGQSWCTLDCNQLIVLPR